MFGAKCGRRAGHTGHRNGPKTLSIGRFTVTIGSPDLATVSRQFQNSRFAIGDRGLSDNESELTIDFRELPADDVIPARGRCRPGFLRMPAVNRRLKVLNREPEVCKRRQEVCNRRAQASGSRRAVCDQARQASKRCHFGIRLPYRAPSLRRKSFIYNYLQCRNERVVISRSAARSSLLTAATASSAANGGCA